MYIFFGDNNVGETTKMGGFDFSWIFSTPLFKGLDDFDRSALEKHFPTMTRHYPGRSVIFYAGDLTQKFAMVLDGEVVIEHVDAFSSRHILAHVGPGDIFAETYAFLADEMMPVDAVTPGGADVLMLDRDGLLSPGMVSPEGRAVILENLLSMSMRKNLVLSKRILYTTGKTIRSRLMRYLTDEMVRNHGQSFSIPFDRQELADYLSVDRSALSAEISKLRREGVLVCRKNRFSIIMKKNTAL